MSAPTPLAVSDLIYSGFRIAGILGGAGRTNAPEDMAEGLRVLNSMLDAWKAQRLTVYAILRTLVQVQSNKQDYTVGADGADIIMDRPERIENAGFLYLHSTPPTEIQMTPLTEQQWKALSPKGLKSTIPYQYYYETEFPLGIIHLWPIPTDGTNQFSIYTWQVIQQFGSDGDNVQIPPAYQEAIEYQLALRLAQRYPLRQKMSPLAVAQAAAAFAKVKSINTPNILMQTESGAREVGQKGRYDIISNTYRSV